MLIFSILLGLIEDCYISSNICDYVLGWFMYEQGYLSIQMIILCMYVNGTLMF